MRTLIVMLSLFLCGTPLSAAPQSIDVIVVEYPPYTTPDHPDGGLIFRKFKNWLDARNLAIALRPRFLPPARAQHEVDTTDWCISFYPPSKDTPHVFKQISQERIDMRLVRRKSEVPFSWTSLEVFRGKKMAMLRALSIEEEYRPFTNAGVEFIFVETMEQALTMVAQGRVDFASADRESLSFHNDKFPDLQKLEASGKIIRSYPVGMFLSERCKDILGSLNEKDAAKKTASLQN